MTCERTVKCGAGFTHVCDRPSGHSGEHMAHWIDRDGVRRLGLTWTHESWDAYAVFPTARGAISAVKEER